MSTNDEIARLTQAVQEHTQVTEGFLDQADARITAKEDQVNSFIQDAQNIDVQSIGFIAHSGTVDSDTEWHPILTNLNGHFLGELILRTDQSSYHSIGIFTVAITFASGKIHARTSGSGYGTDTEVRITGTTYDYSIEIRTTASSLAANPSNSDIGALRWKLMKYKI